MNAEQHPHSPQADKQNKRPVQPEDVMEITVCRGLQGTCRHCLVYTQDWVNELKQAVQTSTLAKRLAQLSQSGTLPHARLRIALAGCPNACSMPQIKAIGIIARHRPAQLRSGCDLCMACVQCCKENALQVESNHVVFKQPLCVGCGLCLDACPLDLILAQDLRFEIWIAGTMGRHPQLAQSLGEVAPDQVVPVFSRILETMADRIQDSQSIPAMLRSMDIATLKKQIDL